MLEKKIKSTTLNLGNDILVNTMNILTRIAFHNEVRFFTFKNNAPRMVLMA